LSLFFYSPLADFIFFFSFHCCPTSCMCCLHWSSHRFSGGSYSGFLFCFCCFFFVVFRKKICFGSEGVARDKLVFGMLKHGHVSFQILTRYFCSLDFGTKPLINMLLIVFFFYYIFYYPNFCLGRPFGLLTYRVRTSDLPLGSLKAYARCLLLPQCRAMRYLLLSFVPTL